MENNRKRQWLARRILKIKEAKIKNIIIPNWKTMCERFMEKYPKLAPRTQRDFPRLMALIKAHALLNCFTRKTAENETIIADKADIDEGFNWYGKIMKPNELGLAPETYAFYIEIFYCEDDGLTVDEILQKYFKLHRRTLDRYRLERDILPALKSASVILEKPDDEDRRRKRYVPTDGGNLGFRAFIPVKE